MTGYGCPGISPVASGLVAAELARADGGIRDFFAVQELAILTIDMLGSVDQKRRWLPSLARMERIGAFAMTEPTHGSDASSLETRARRNSNHYILDGAKRWITNGSIADLLVLWARDEDGAVGGFILEPPLDGFEATPMDGKAAAGRPITPGSVSRASRSRSTTGSSAPARLPTPAGCWSAAAKASPGRRSATPWRPTMPPWPTPWAVSSSAGRWRPPSSSRPGWPPCWWT